MEPDEIDGHAVVFELDVQRVTTRNRIGARDRQRDRPYQPMWRAGGDRQRPRSRAGICDLGSRRHVETNERGLAHAPAVVAKPIDDADSAVIAPGLGKDRDVSVAQPGTDELEFVEARIGVTTRDAFAPPVEVPFDDGERSQASRPAQMPMRCARSSRW